MNLFSPAGASLGKASAEGWGGPAREGARHKSQLFRELVLSGPSLWVGVRVERVVLGEQSLLKSLTP